MTDRRRTNTDDRDAERRWRIPPPPLGSVGYAGLEGLPVLEEVEGPLGELLWRTLRSLSTWAETPADRREDLFPSDLVAARVAAISSVDPPAPLIEPLRTLAEILRGPVAVDTVAASAAAAAIADWAQDEHHLRTAAQFRQLAANISPEDAARALAAARSARDRADYPRAEVWLQRAIGLSRRARDWESYVKAFLAYGKMMRWRGNMPAARKHYERALRRARRQGLQVAQGEALHDLFSVELEGGRYDEAERLAAQAVQTFPAGDEGLVWLAHDVGYLWLAKESYTPALRVFQAVEHTRAAAGKPFVYGGMALAAAGSRDERAFHYAVEHLDRLVVGPGTSEAWVEVARGAFQLGRMEVAAEASARGLRIARDRKEHRIEFLAEAAAAEVREVRHRPVVPSDREAPAERLPPLAGDVIRALQAV